MLGEKVYFYDKKDDTYNVFFGEHYNNLLIYYRRNDILCDYDNIFPEHTGKKIKFNDYRDNKKNKFVERIEKRWYCGYYYLIICYYYSNGKKFEESYIWRNIDSIDEVILDEVNKNLEIEFV